jgi:hypothetical protein
VPECKLCVLLAAAVAAAAAALLQSDKRAAMHSSALPVDTVVHAWGTPLPCLMHGQNKGRGGALKG